MFDSLGVPASAFQVAEVSNVLAETDLTGADPFSCTSRVSEKHTPVGVQTVNCPIGFALIAGLLYMTARKLYAKLRKAVA